MEQSIFLPRKQGLLSIQRVFREDRSGTYEICIRDFRHLNFYEMNLNDYPYLIPKGKIDIQVKSQMTCLSMLNYNYVVNFVCGGIMERF